MQNSRRQFRNGIIPHLGILLTSACNLNCRDCADLLPWRPVRQYKKEDFYFDIRKLLSVVNGIGEVLLIGGEVLLYRDLLEILRWCIGESRIRSVILTTNGTIIPEECILEELQNPKVMLRISGYPEFVAPNRKRLIEVVESRKINVVDMQDMQWYDIGKPHARNRTKTELEDVFRNCLMGDCIGITPEGKIYYCSRQQVADETDIYPTPSPEEIIDLRKLPQEELLKKLEDFYELPYISTCDYCDGILTGSHVNMAIPTAVQLLGRDEFLTLIDIMDYSENKDTAREYLLRCATFVKEQCEKLDGYDTIPRLVEILVQLEQASSDTANRVSRLMRELACEVAAGFQYDVKVSSPVYQKYVKRREIFNHRNTVCVQLIDDNEQPLEKADIALTEDDLQNEAYFDNTMNYTQIYLRGGLESSRDIIGVVAGNADCQYGVDCSEFSVPVVNLSADGLDVRYSLRFVEKFLERHRNTRWIALSVTYYSAFSDLEQSESAFHRLVKEQIVYPLLFDREKPMKNLSPLGEAFDLNQLRKDLEQVVASQLDGKDYFDGLYEQRGYGGLSYDFKVLDEEQKYNGAKETADRNRKACEFSHGEVTAHDLKDFCMRMGNDGYEIFLFTPPVTKYLRKQMDPDIEKRFYAEIIPVLQNVPRLHYLDMYVDKDFVDDDFVDFEYLSDSGAKKMSKKLNDWIEHEMSKAKGNSTSM